MSVLSAPKHEERRDAEIDRTVATVTGQGRAGIDGDHEKRGAHRFPHGQAEHQHQGMHDQEATVNLKEAGQHADRQPGDQHAGREGGGRRHTLIVQADARHGDRCDDHQRGKAEEDKPRGRQVVEPGAHQRAADPRATEDQGDSAPRARGPRRRSARWRPHWPAQDPRPGWTRSPGAQAWMGGGTSIEPRQPRPRPPRLARPPEAGVRTVCVIAATPSAGARPATQSCRRRRCACWCARAGAAWPGPARCGRR